MTPLDPILRELGEEHRAEVAPASVERAVAAEFRRRHQRAIWPWVGMAAAAAASVALASFLMQPPPAQSLALHVDAPAAPAVHSTPKLPVVAARAATRRPAKHVAPTAAPEIATDFFPLRAGPVLYPGEVAQVVRTRIPRRELGRFGLAQQDLYSTIGARPDIRADVVFGYDGTARAIRFIHDSQ